MSQKGFTLIEILIVGSIIAILASIATPNFLEAQMRAKVSRAKADQYALATALEAYRVDNNHYPICEYGFLDGRYFPEELEPELPLYVLTTPVAYIHELPQDVFPNEFYRYASFLERQFHYRYYSPWWIQMISDDAPQFVQGRQPVARWALVSSGPDMDNTEGQWLLYGLEVMRQVPVIDAGYGGSYPTGENSALYDPTNGVVSAGDIVRIGP